MAYRTFFFLYCLIVFGGIALADGVVENVSNDTLYIAIVFQPEITSNAQTPTLGNGFWTVKPKEKATLVTGNVRKVWLRVLVKNSAGTLLELHPVGSSRIRLGTKECAWTSQLPSTFSCLAKVRMSPVSQEFPVSLGTKNVTNFLRERIAEGNSYEFFEISKQPSGSFHWSWK